MTEERQMAVQFETKAAVTVAEMARMCGLSRARFYELVEAGVFPPPVHCVSTRRPMYVEEQQQVCLEVRRRNCGVNGRPVLFYAARGPATVGARKTIKVAPKPAPKDERIAALLAGLNGLGLTTATGVVVEQITQEIFPAGTAGIDPGEVLRQVFLELRRRDKGDKQGR
jgi:hypothetical protein